MGAGQSRQVEAQKSKKSNENYNTGITDNGDVYRDDDDGPTSQKSDNFCKPCFFLVNGFNTNIRKLPFARKNSDAMGSPIPDTPLHLRRRRMNDDPVYSSTYLGLEKEVSNSTRTTLSSGDIGLLFDNMEQLSSTESNNSRIEKILTTVPQISDDIAQIYEGPDAEQQLNNKYQLMEVLGVGSTSTVHRCIRISTAKQCACKVIDCALIDDRFHGMMSQFRVEIDTLRQLQHPGIIRLYDVYYSDTKIFIVMELMEGGELFDYVVEKGTLTEEEASRIVYKVTSALVYMHSKDIVHRDLKPENLLLKKKPYSGYSPSATSQRKDNQYDEHLDVKIIDFGLSKEMEGALASTFLGTRGYLAPEMLQRRNYTRAVDTWALGVIVFVLLCGCLPFDDEISNCSNVLSDDAMHMKFVLRFPRWAKNLSPSAKDLLHRLLDINPNTRYTAEQALQHEWVQGLTARRDKLLASPGRIKKSPMLPGNRNQTKPGRKYVPADASVLSPANRAPYVVRQVSL